MQSLCPEKEEARDEGEEKEGGGKTDDVREEEGEVNMEGPTASAAEAFFTRDDVREGIRGERLLMREMEDRSDHGIRCGRGDV